MLGKYNTVNNDAVLVVGTGTSNSNRVNGFQVLADGSARVATASTEDDAVVRYSQIKNLFGSKNTFGIGLNAKNDQQVVLGSYNSPSDASLVLGAGMIHEEIGEIHFNALESYFSAGEYGGGLVTKLSANALLLTGDTYLNLESYYGLTVKTDYFNLNPYGISIWMVSYKDELGNWKSEDYESVGIQAPEVHFEGSAAIRTQDGLLFKDYSNNTVITGLKAPVADNDAVNKKYVDDKISAINIGGDKSGLVLTDKTTGIDYKVYIENGKLQLEEVVN